MWIDKLKSAKVLVLDSETTIQWSKEDGKTWDTDGSPFNPKNKLVSVNWRVIRNGSIGPNNYSVFYHDEKDLPDSTRALAEAIEWADVIVAHNAKFDIVWLLESNFNLESKIVYCTMIGEYVLARGQRKPLSLKETAIRRRVTTKKSDLTEEYLSQRIGFDKMPLEVVMEYADADVLSCAEIFLQQLDDYSDVEHSGLVPVLEMMNDMLLVLVDMERSGLCIDLEALDKVRIEYEEELAQLEHDLSVLATEALGDTPFNLNSGGDLSALIYSRVPKDKALHASTFNIGYNEDGKPLYRPRMKPNEFTAAVKATTELVYKTKAHHCKTCKGKGFIRKIKKDGTPFKKVTKCKECDARGFTLTSTGEVAGFQLFPDSPLDASVHGFSADKTMLDRLIAKATANKNPKAVEFLTKHVRRSKVRVYLDTFVGGIQKWVRDDNLLHPQMNQTVAATGRLSSSNPNYQNQPRSGTFPVRRAVVSRFEGGSILEADYSSLEFVIAAELSQDSRAKKRILDKEDEHKQTASIIHRKPVEEVTKEERTLVKPYTFKPLYGGTGANEPEHIANYLDSYTTEIYPEIGEWHQRLMDDAIAYGIISTPSGREYKFDHVKRTRNGKVTQFTKIVNYPVQGFATGDIVPLGCIRVRRMLKEHNCKSVLILTVHDSVLVDVYPGEEKLVAGIVFDALTKVAEEIKQRFDYEMTLPLRVEMSIGKNWLDTKEIEI